MTGTAQFIENMYIPDEALGLINCAIRNRIQVDILVDELDKFQKLTENDADTYEHYVTTILEASKWTQEVERFMFMKYFLRGRVGPVVEGKSPDLLWLVHWIDFQTLKKLNNDNSTFKAFRDLDVDQLKEDWDNFKDKFPLTPTPPPTPSTHSECESDIEQITEETVTITLSDNATVSCVINKK